MNTKEITIKTVVDISVHRLQGLLVGAFEQGYSWHCIQGLVIPEGHTKEEYRWKDTTGHWSPVYCLPFVDGGGVKIGEDTEDDGTYPVTHILNKEKIEKGLQLMADKYPYHFSHIVNEGDDANTSDVFLQCCLLGELVYG